MRMKPTIVCLTAAVVLLAADLAQAGPTYWQNPGAGNWSIDANWTHGEPGCDDSAYINNGGTAQITAPNDESCRWLHLGEGSGDSGTVDMTGGSLSVTSGLYVGRYGTGTLNITGGGALTSDWGTICCWWGSSGAVAVEGPGSTWTDSGNLSVGMRGSGTLTITGGGLVSVGGRLTIGGDGNGALAITAGGAVTSDGGTIGDWFGSTGAVTVEGAGSTWTNGGALYVGYYGSGALDITGAGAVTSDYGSIGGSTGAVTVEGPGSTWTNSGGLSVGLLGDGTLDITAGGQVTVGGNTWVSRRARWSGSIHLDTGTLTTGGLACAFDDLTGEGTINTHGLVTDVDLVFDAAHGLNQTFTIHANPGQNITLNLDVDGSGVMGAGYGGDGTMRISDGRVVQSTGGRIAYKSGSTGAVTVTGPGSTWTNSDTLYVGYRGAGTLDISGGGEVTVEEQTWVCREPGSSGTINFDNGTLTTGGLLCAVDALTGTGTINTHGLVTDVDLVFDATHGLNQTFTIDDNPGRNITVNLDVDGSGMMGAGYASDGTMSVSDGRAVQSTGGEIGYKFGSTGAVRVDGNGSTWTNSMDLYVGASGDGTLNITGGGAVSNGFGHIGFYTDATGAVRVDGNGSTWANSERLYVGWSGDGTLTISGGGAVSSGYGYIGNSSGSIGAVTVEGAGSTWTNSDALFVGYFGDGTLNITGGGAVSSGSGYIGSSSGSIGAVTVEGAGSTWANSGNLYVGFNSGCTLVIAGGGLVAVGDILTIDWDEEGDSFINMTSGGMLALFGDADDSLGDFLDLIEGTDAIRYWDDDISDWDWLTNATVGEDYDLSYLTAGDLSGYTMLTVPEPATLALLAVGGLGLLARRKKGA